MKPTFHHRPLGGPFDDPVVCVRLFMDRRALLFDCGDIHALSPGDLLKVSDVFVTHMHMDHFSGFDTLLRVILTRATPLHVYGPENIIECVDGKLHGYTWNLVESYPCKVEVFSLTGEKVRHVSFHASERFIPRDNGTLPFSGTLMESVGFSIDATMLDHGIPAVGYTLNEEYHININKDAVLKMGLEVGPWLGELKRLLRTGADAAEELMANGQVFRFGDLQHLASMTTGQKLSYIVDTSPTDENINKIIELVRGSDTLYCEAYFLDGDFSAARERSHLTGKIAGQIARRAGVRELIPIHCSPRYLQEDTTPIDEALDVFSGD
jgi:ribonuclease Z